MRSLALAPFFASLGPPLLDPGEAAVRALVEAAQGGDGRAVRELYRLHVGRVFRAARAWTRSESDAEDATQEAFVRAFRALPTWRPRPGVRFCSWLLTIALNVVRRRARGEARVTPEPEPGLRVEAEGARDPVGDELVRGLRRGALLAALEELSPRDRELVGLRYGSELTSAEVAEATGLSEANVRKICERARRVLLDALRGGEADEADEAGGAA